MDIDTILDWVLELQTEFNNLQLRHDIPAYDRHNYVICSTTAHGPIQVSMHGLHLHIQDIKRKAHNFIWTNGYTKEAQDDFRNLIVQTFGIVKNASVHKLPGHLWTYKEQEWTCYG